MLEMTADRPGERLRGLLSRPPARLCRPPAVIYQDEDVIVVDKPPGLTVHPAPGHPSGTLVNALLALAPELAEVGDRIRPGIVHRLDRDTSGLVVVAPNGGPRARLRPP